MRRSMVAGGPAAALVMAAPAVAALVVGPAAAQPARVDVTRPIAGSVDPKWKLPGADCDGTCPLAPPEAYRCVADKLAGPAAQRLRAFRRWIVSLNRSQDPETAGQLSQFLRGCGPYRFTLTALAAATDGQALAAPEPAGFTYCRAKNPPTRQVFYSWIWLGKDSRSEAARRPFYEEITGAFHNARGSLEEPACPSVDSDEAARAQLHADQAADEAQGWRAVSLGWTPEPGAR